MPEQNKKDRPLSASTIELARNDLVVRIEPEAGGALSQFSFAEWEILRPSAHSASLESSCFALAPYANRIRDGAFEFRGRNVALDGASGVAHALHGHGWRASWDVIESDGRRAVLAYRYEPDDWPWSYVCKQVVELSEDSLRMELSVRNTDRSPMPAGLGFHPRFESSPGARLTARVTGFWDADRDILPTQRREGVHLGDWTRGDEVARTREIDNCFWGWDGQALLELPAKNLRVTISASPTARMLHLYLPLDRRLGFCIEPVTHAPDAFNSSEGNDVTGLTVLAPGETLVASMELRVSRSM